MQQSKSKIRVYIAAPFFNPEQLKVVKDIEDMLDSCGVTYFSPRSEGTLIEMTDEERKVHMGNMFRSNVDHMDWCSHCIAVIDNYDTGTVWEMGYLYATHKKIVTYSANYHGINVMLNESIEGHCVHMMDLYQALHGKFESTKTSDVT